MKVNIPQTRSIVLICLLAFGILQHAASAADERQTLQALSKSFTTLAQEVGEMVVGIQIERPNEHKDWTPHFENFERRDVFPFVPEHEFRRWFRQNSDRNEKSENHFFPGPNWKKQDQRHDVIPIPEGKSYLIQDKINFGSGILLDENGHIATVIELVDDRNEITITLQNRTRLDATVVASDKSTGIAVLKVDTDAVAATKFGDSDDIAIGELMVTLGHTADQEPSISLGMISGVGRNPNIVDYENWFAIDTNQSPGFGGSAIVSAKGEIIGMITGSSPNNVFAIPINTVRQVATELIEHGKVARGWLGVAIQEVDESLAEKLGLDRPMGGLINYIFDSTPAAESGLQKGDVIVAINNETIKNANHLRATIAMYKPTTTVSVSILRDGQTQDISVTLGGRSARLPRSANDLEGHTEHWKGLSVQNLTADLAEKLGYTAAKGVLIADVASGSAAAKAGLRKGDLILEVENQPIHSIAEFKAAVEKVKDGTPTLLLVKHKKQTRYVTVK